MSVSTFTKNGMKAATPAKLDKKVFGVDIASHELLKKAYVAYLANGRANLAKTKKRGEVRGGGRKPIRQKGTGFARVGSTRNPLRTGGGVAFGPTGNENYKINLSRQSKKRALRQALTLAAQTEKIVIIEDFSIVSGKTKEASKFLDKINAKGRVLLAVDTKTDEQIRSLSNLSDLKLVQARYVNVYDVLNADTLVLTKAALTNLTEGLEK